MKKKKATKKKAIVKDGIYDLYLHYNEIVTGGEETNPGEEFSSHEPYEVDFTPLNFYHFLLEKSPFIDKIYSNSRHFEVDFDPTKHQEAYAVIVRYTTGDTFGSTHGAWEAAKIVLTKKEAEQVAKDIKNETGEYHPSAYCAWRGYFQSFESVGIHKLDIVCHA